MTIQISIPDEFVSHFNQDRFQDSLQRLMMDANSCAGRYERELAEMLRLAFKRAVIVNYCTCHTK